MLKSIFKDIRTIGGQAYIVGGYVRDKLLGLDSKDIDIEVYQISPQELEGILANYGEFRLVGKSYPIYLLGEYEFSFPQQIIEGRQKKKLIADPAMSVEEATSRRDLTINSILYDPLDDKIIDIYGGREDLKRGIISYVNRDTFQQDPLRILRVAQFKARFEFEVDKETEELCKNLILELKKIAKERIFIEIEKMLLKAKNPSIAFRWMKKVGILADFFPEIEQLSEIEQGEKYHPEGSVFEHTMLALDVLPIEERNIALMLAVLYHDVGKAYIQVKQSGDRIHFYGHEQAGADRVEEFLNKITDNKQLIEKVKKLVKYHMRPLNLRKHLSKKAIRKLATQIDIPQLLKLHQADVLGRGMQVDISYIDNIMEVYNEVKDEIKPLIMGRHLIDLGVEPSKRLGVLLKEIYQAQLDGKFSDLVGGLEYAKDILNLK
jgi:tRNA nucleotidyltransferase (CCA-adding enzyme)